MPTFGSLFAGIGGFDLGLERAGWTCRWQVEIDVFCQRVLAQHWPRVPRHGDIRSFPAADTERVDLICGGFPCQPVSIAGRRLGTDDARWLWPELERVIRVLRPRYALLENVPGLLTRGFGDVLGGLAACGYDAEWDCIPAGALGAPHIRDRVIVVAYPGRELQSAARGQCATPALGYSSRRDIGGRGGGDHRQEPIRVAGQDPRVLSDASGELSRQLRWQRSQEDRESQWHLHWSEGKPPVSRVADGVPLRMDRLRALGNAIVPQVAEWIGRRLLNAANEDGSERVIDR